MLQHIHTHNTARRWPPKLGPIFSWTLLVGNQFHALVNMGPTLKGASCPSQIIPSLEEVTLQPRFDPETMVVICIVNSESQAYSYENKVLKNVYVKKITHSQRTCHLHQVNNSNVHKYRKSKKSI